jgi:hypothetical protein
MKNTPSFSDAELLHFIAEAKTAPPPEGLATRGIFDRLARFNQLHAALAEKPMGPALLYRVPGTDTVRCEELHHRVVIGRLPKTERHPDGADLGFPQLSEMSRVHFEIVRDGRFHLVRDLASRNGTFLNDHPIRTEYQVLKAGDVIAAGGVAFAYTGGE